MNQLHQSGEIRFARRKLIHRKWLGGLNEIVERAGIPGFHLHIYNPHNALNLIKRNEITTAIKPVDDAGIAAVLENMPDSFAGVRPFGHKGVRVVGRGNSSQLVMRLDDPEGIIDAERQQLLRELAPYGVEEDVTGQYYPQLVLGKIAVPQEIHRQAAQALSTRLPEQIVLDRGKIGLW